jgi:predicted protein tyrosine phosphatase
MAGPGKEPIRTLFVCHYNRKRSATAERVFAKNPALDVRSAGTSDEAMVQVNERMLEWADIVFVMDAGQQSDLARLFPNHAALDRLVCLDIEDRYDFLNPELVSLLEERTRPHLARLAGG